VKKKAALSKTENKFPGYVNWLKSGDIEFEILDWEENNFEKIKNCSSLVLCGGVDVFPEFYTDWNDDTDKSKYIPERDGFEFRLAEYALQNNIPILAVCRGMQLLNCKLNGSLINDIETVRGVNHRKLDDGKDRYHNVNLLNGSFMNDVIGKTKGVINSSHHQAIDRAGEGLIVSAKADDGIVEGIEWAEKDSKAFLIGVQWHPERMLEMTSEFSSNILKRFKRETEKA